MQNIGKTIADQFKGYAASWAAYSAFGSFVLYLLGYLVTRFELTMLGVARNLDVLEERYFFAGAKFVVYLLATVPSLLLLLLVPAAIVWLLGRLLPAQRAVAPSDYSTQHVLCHWHYFCHPRDPVRGAPMLRFQ